MRSRVRMKGGGPGFSIQRPFGARKEVQTGVGTTSFFERKNLGREGRGKNLPVEWVNKG